MDGADMIEVMRNPNLSVGSRLLWWELNQWTSGDLRDCFPPQHALGEALNVSRASILRWTQELQDAGLVAVRRVGRGNKYTLYPCGQRARQQAINVAP